MDFDAIVIKSFAPLRKYDVVLGQKLRYSLANGIILAKRAAPFLRIWLETYHTFQANEWAEHSCIIPMKLSKMFPHLLHIEETSLIRPNWQEADLLFNGHYPWRKNYAIHVWKRRGKVASNETELVGLNSTLGELMRHVLGQVLDTYHLMFHSVETERFHAIVDPIDHLLEEGLPRAIAVSSLVV